MGLENNGCDVQEQILVLYHCLRCASTGKIHHTHRDNHQFLSDCHSCSGSWELVGSTQWHRARRLFFVLLRRKEHSALQDSEARETVPHGWTTLRQVGFTFVCDTPWFSFRILWNLDQVLLCFCSIATIVDRYKIEQIVEGFLLGQPVVKVSDCTNLECLFMNTNAKLSQLPRGKEWWMMVMNDGCCLVLFPGERDSQFIHG